MDVREKLVEIIHKIYKDSRMDFYDLWEMNQEAETIADIMIENGVTVQEWISVKDRLPEENERVLACYINPLRKDRPPRMMVGEGTSTQIVKGKVYLWCGGWRSITHWMPLPQPPKEETIYCKDCEHLMFSDCYGECAKAYKGIVRPDDTCEHAVRRKPKGE